MTVTDDRRLHNELLREVREAAAANAALPGELELTARLGCTRQQLRNALAELERQGIPVSYTHLTLPTSCSACRGRWGGGG